MTKRQSNVDVFFLFRRFQVNAGVVSPRRSVYYLRLIAANRFLRRRKTRRQPPDPSGGCCCCTGGSVGGRRRRRRRVGGGGGGGGLPFLFIPFIIPFSFLSLALRPLRARCCILLKWPKDRDRGAPVFGRPPATHHQSFRSSTAAETLSVFSPFFSLFFTCVFGARRSTWSTQREGGIQSNQLDRLSRRIIQSRHRRRRDDVERLV